MKKILLIASLYVMFLWLLEAGAAPADSVTLYVTPSASASLRVPVAVAADDWLPFTTFGVSCAVPSTLPALACFFAVEAGSIPRRGHGFSVQTICFELGLQADLLRIGPDAGFGPVAGLSSMMVGMEDGVMEFSSLHTFRNVENEYGFFAGVAPWYRWNHIEMELVLTAGRTLSYPVRFTTVAAALRIGYKVE